MNGAQGYALDRGLAERVLRMTVEAVAILDGDSRIRWVNEAFKRITGYRPDEVLGREPVLFRSDHHDPAFYARMHRILHEEGFWSGEVWRRRRDGSVVPVMLTVTRLFDDDGEPIGYVDLFSDISEHKHQEQELEFLVNHDALTSLPNRWVFESRLEQALKRLGRSGGAVAVLFLDLDHFKAINDSHGHAVGDDVLGEAGRRVAGNVRETDTVARLGGDEFVVLLELETGTHGVRVVADKILAAFRAPFELQGLVMFVTVSIGARLTTSPETTAAEMLRRSDAAMYEAKRDGRDRYHLDAGNGA